jgi:hypothetical protein
MPLQRFGGQGAGLSSYKLGYMVTRHVETIGVDTYQRSLSGPPLRRQRSPGCPGLASRRKAGR